MSFNSIIGHENIKNYIDNSIRKDKFSHAHIIVGEDGIGKSIIAFETALRILNKTIRKQYADIMEFKLPQNKKSIGVEQIRDIIEETNRKPYEGDKKVIIIHSVDSMTEAAQNAFLKTLEEPPKGVYIMLLCESIESILETIKSRCQIYKLNRLNDEEMKEYISVHFPELDQKGQKALIAFSDGIPGRSERFVNDNYLREIRNITLEILLKISNNNIEKLLKYDEALTKYKGDEQEIFTWFLSYIRDGIIYKETSDKNLIINIDKITEIKCVAEKFSFKMLDDIINIIKDARNKMESNVNPSLVFSAMLIKMKEV